MKLRFFIYLRQKYTFGGPIDINYRTFVDSVVVQVRQHLPLNVKNWKEIQDENKSILKAKVLVFASLNNYIFIDFQM